MVSELEPLSAMALLKAAASRVGMQFVEVVWDEQTSTVTIDPATARFTCTREGRKEISNPSQKNWRWAAGGGFIALRFRDQKAVGLLRYRDPGAPSFGDHFTLGSGISSGISDMLYPLLLASREGIEEFLITTPAGLVVPTFDDPKLDEISYGAVASGLKYIRAAEDLNLPMQFGWKHFVGVHSYFHPTKNDREIKVAVEGSGAEPIVSKGVWVVDPGTRGLDLIEIVVTDLPCSLDDVAIFDGEGNEKKSFNAPVVCLELDYDTLRPTGEIVRTFQSGKVVKNVGNISKVTPVLRKALEALA